jgi:hypothetical protein
MPSVRKKNLLVLVVAAALLFPCGIIVWRSVPLVRFEPVRIDTHQHLQATKEVLTKEQADRVEAVLRQYGETCCRIDSGSILITLGLRGDTELVRNYTIKSGL